MIKLTFSAISFCLLALVACNRQAPAIPPPTEGPAVVGEGVEVAGWEYFSAPYPGPLPAPSATVREVEENVRLIQTEDGFDLMWLQLRDATQPVLVIHSDNSMEFWPGPCIKPEPPPAEAKDIPAVSLCPAVGMFHKLTVELQEPVVPIQEWEFTLHSPPDRE